MNGILILTIVFTLPILVRSQDEETTTGTAETTATTENETTTESFTTTEQVTTETTAAPTMYGINIYVNHLRNKCFSTSTQTTEEATTTTQETTTEQPTTIITTTEHDIPESYEGRKIFKLRVNVKRQMSLKKLTEN